MRTSLPTAISRSFRRRVSSLPDNSSGHLSVAIEAALRGRPALADADHWSLVRSLVRFRMQRGDEPGAVAVPSSRALRSLVALMDAVAPGCLPFADTVLDPCCATGTVLAELRLHTRARLYGWECDPVWAALAKHTSPDAEIAASDLFTTPRPPEAQALVMVSCIPAVGHDPGQSRSAVENARRARFRRTGWKSSSTSELAAALTRMVRDLLRPGEVAGVLLPVAFLRARRFRSLRDSLLRACERVAVVELPRERRQSVGGWAALACVRAPELLFHDRPSSWLQYFAVEDAGLVHRGEVHVSFARRQAADDGDDELQLPPVEWVVPPSDGATLALLRGRGFPELGALVTVQDGVNAGSRDARARVLRDTPDGMQRPWPVASTSDLRAGVIEPSLRWLETSAEVMLEPELKRSVSLREPGLFERPRLYLAQRARSVVTAMVSADGPWALSGVHVLSWKGTRSSLQSLSRLCGILNTPLMLGAMVELQGGRLDARRRISGRVLATLPVPWPLPRELHATAEMAAGGNAEAMDELQRQLQAWLATER